MSVGQFVLSNLSIYSIALAQADGALKRPTPDQVDSLKLKEGTKVRVYRNSTQRGDPLLAGTVAPGTPDDPSVACEGLQPSELLSAALSVGTDPARSVASAQRLSLAIAFGYPLAPDAPRPIVAQPLFPGMLLAAGFETSSQLSALILAGRTNAWLLGAAFSVGMVMVDGLDGFLAATTQRLAFGGRRTDQCEDRFARAWHPRSDLCF